MRPADERISSGEIEMIGDQHQIARLERLIEAARGVREDRDLRACLCARRTLTVTCVGEKP